MGPEDVAAKELRALLAAGARISWDVRHARQRAVERQVPTFVAERIVRAAASVRITKASDGSTTWRVSGTDPDGRPVDVVVYPVMGAVRVITVIRTDQ